MGRFKLGEQVCNNCIHWKCNDKREFQGNPPREVYTCVNCADCGRTGRSQSARDTCPFFAHIGGVTVTFPSASSVERTDTSTMETSPGESYFKATMEAIQNRRAMQASDENLLSRKQQETMIQDDDADDEASREFRRWGEERQRALERSRELLREGLDTACMFGDEAVEFMHLLDRARDGDATDQRRLAFAFWNGEHGAEEDHYRAACWFGKASDEDSEARFMHGLCFMSGVSGNDGIIAQNISEGISLIVSSAESGNEDANEWIIENAGMDSNSSDADKAEFMRLLKEANDGDAEIQYELAVALALGRRGARKDRTYAAEWYEKSAKSGKIEAMVALADYYRDGEVEDKGIDDAIELYKKAAIKGNWRAQHVLAELYSSGEPMNVDYAEAIKWALLAADNDGTADVFCLLGKCFENGLGTDKDVAKAFQFYQKAAQKDNDEAKKALSRLGKSSDSDSLYGDVKFGPSVSDLDKDACRKVYNEALLEKPGAEYEMGNVLSMGMYGIFVNKKEAFGWYLKSAEHGFADAQYEVGRFYSLGVKDVVDCNDEEKFKWYWEAAAQGHVESMRGVADCFYYGSGVSEDDDEAKMWYVRAAKGGDETSLEKLKNHWELSDEELQSSYHIVETNPAGMNRKSEEADKDVFREMFKKAKAGDAAAQFQLGHAFVYGENGAKMNEHHGLMWLKKAAAQGNADAENLLGDCYYHGRGVEEDESEAAKHYQAAAKGGNAEAQSQFDEILSEVISRDMCDAASAEEIAEFKKSWAGAVSGDSAAQYNLACVYYYGKIGVIRDTDLAFKWFNRTAKQDSVGVLLHIGKCYGYGQGVDKDAEKADEYGKRAIALATQGEAVDQYEIARFYWNGWKPFEKNNDEAVRWYKLAVEQGHSEAEYMLGFCYYCGYGVEKNFVEAVKWLMKSAKQDSPKAQSLLGDCYRLGRGDLEKDDVCALEWYKRAAENGNAAAEYWIAEFYEDGRGGLEKDQVKSFEWRLKSAQHGDEDAMNSVGWAYQKGLGTEIDGNKAFEWYRKGVDKGSAAAMNNLAKCYEDAIGVDADIDRAFELFQQSADKGFSRGCYHLGRFYENGLGVDADIDKAKELYKKAADKGDKDAKVALERLG